jgi:hypothetical protein
MISRRTILLYNFGLAITLLISGLLTIYTLALLNHDSLTIARQADVRAKAVRELAEEQDLERLRSTASFYLRVTEDLKKARDEDTVIFLTDIRYACFLLASIFVVGGLLGIALRTASPLSEPN